MSERKPVKVQITYGRNKRGTFILNGEDMSDRISYCSVEVHAGKIAYVTFRMHADELEADVEGNSEGEAAQS